MTFTTFIVLFIIMSIVNGEQSDNGIETISLTEVGKEKLISSMGYPYDCPRSHSKQWNINGPKGKKIMVTCSDVFFPKSLICQHGALLIWDGKNTKRFCGVSKHLVVRSEENQLKIKIRTARYSKGRIHCFVKIVETTKPLGVVSSEERPINLEPSHPTKSTTCSCGWTNKKTRIVGGTETSPNEFPFMVSIMGAVSKKRICGGSIITDQHILTAAHCIDNKKDVNLLVSIGEHDITNQYSTNTTEFIEVEQKLPHGLYDPKLIVNDIAILVLSKKIKFSKQVGPICLPSVKTNLVKQFVKVLGWGETNIAQKSTGLRQTDLEVIDIETCSSKYHYSLNTRSVTQTCTFSKNKDSCQGDSGGPLVWHDPEISRYTQVALVSFGKMCASSYPAVNTDVFAFMDWIGMVIRMTGDGTKVCKKIN